MNNIPNYAPPANMNEPEVLEWLSTLKPAYPCTVELVPGEPIRIDNVEQLKDLIDSLDTGPDPDF